MVHPVEWRSGAVVLLDQRLLPAQEVYRVYRDHRDVARAIKDMVVRGAPAIGVAAAMGIALGMAQKPQGDPARAFDRICRRFAATRPTAVNLFWAIGRMKKAFARARGRSPEILREVLRQEAMTIYHEDIAGNRALGLFGAALLRPRATVLTHCNAGALATAGYGTALGVVRAAHEKGKLAGVFATETRPFLQGARLTAWELKKDKIPVTLITDGMAGHFLKGGTISCVIVGADRVAANGDVANKIGTYTVAALAARHKVPFYVAAPTSTIDLACPNGEAIPIEERSAREVTHVGERPVAPSGVRVANPAFDVTPHALVTAIITERGVARPPYRRAFARLFATEGRGPTPIGAAEPRTGTNSAREKPRELRRQPARA
jgi:methylthioribose-1-phosphate isomerase